MGDTEYRQDNPGGGGAIVSAAPKNVRPTDLETALAKPNTLPPVTEPIQVPAPEPTAAQADGTPTAYQHYLKTYPEGTFNGLARNRLTKLGNGGPSEPQAWQQAEQAHSREGYDRFLQAHPNSAYAALAKARLARLK